MASFQATCQCIAAEGLNPAVMEGLFQIPVSGTPTEGAIYTVTVTYTDPVWVGV